VDQKTQKWVTPIDTECSGKPNLYLVSNQEGAPPEYALLDQVGDGKIDVKIIYKFDGKADLWIFYGRRDGTPTAFGYDYGSGKLERVIPLNAAAQ
jgi:hypothetical protein